MAKPTDLVRWATGVGAVIVPTEAQKDTGWLTGDRPPAKILNWLANRSYGWFQYLNSLHVEPDFLNKAYRWVGKHDFASQGASTNASFRLRDFAEIYYANTDDTAPEARSRTILISPLAGVPQVPATDVWFVDYDDGPVMYTLLEGKRMSYDISIPSGCVLKNVSVGFHMAQAHTTGPVFTLRTTFPDFTGANGTTIDTHTQTLTATAGAKVYTQGVPINATADRANIYFTLDVLTASGGAGQQRIQWIAVTYDDIGPRNF